MASGRFTAAEKGKQHASQSKEGERKRIRAPRIDMSAFIKDNELTLIGRVTNAKEQDVVSLLSALPRDWNLRGKITGSDLGLNCFQFRFELETDLNRVLANRPYHYHHWMVVLQKWEPVISPTFPSQIPFWVKLQGLPLHFWHESMIYNIGQEFGQYDSYHISKTSARVRVFVDAFKPLIVDPLIEFENGEELGVALEYENLQLHCPRVSSHTSSTAAPQEQNLLPLSRNVEHRDEQIKEPFHQRIDRHGRPFGSRIPPPEIRGNPLKNKLIPPRNPQRDNRSANLRGRHFNRTQENNYDTRRSPEAAITRASPHLVWREKEHTVGPVSPVQLFTCLRPPPTRC